MIEVMNLRNTKPTEPYDFIVDRTTTLGNPFRLAFGRSRDQICNLHKAWFDKQIEEHDVGILNRLQILRKVYEKYGKLRLFCWCTPKRCHADYIGARILLWGSGKIKNYEVPQVDINKAF